MDTGCIIQGYLVASGLKDGLAICAWWMVCGLKFMIAGGEKFGLVESPWEVVDGAVLCKIPYQWIDYPKVPDSWFFA